MKYKLFISHSSDDMEKVRLIENHLKDNIQFEPVIIANKRDADTLLVDKVIKGIKDSHFIIPIITRNSIEKQWINQEIGFAKAYNKKIVPVVDEALIENLKGFIHKQIDLPYKYSAGSLGQLIPSGDNQRFMEKFKLLLDDIQEEKLKPNIETVINQKEETKKKTSPSIQERETIARYKPNISRQLGQAIQNNIMLDFINKGETITIKSAVIKDGQMSLGPNKFPAYCTKGGLFRIILTKPFIEKTNISTIIYKLDIIIKDELDNEYSISLNCTGASCEIGFPILLS